MGDSRLFFIHFNNLLDSCHCVRLFLVYLSNSLLVFLINNTNINIIHDLDCLDIDDGTSAGRTVDSFTENLPSQSLHPAGMILIIFLCGVLVACFVSISLLDCGIIFWRLIIALTNCVDSFWIKLFNCFSVFIFGARASSLFTFSPSLPGLR